jgi:3-oxoacyl-[acyl-carrier-protein] synthase-3
MTFIRYKNIGITGISACVPKKVVKNICLNDIFSDNTLKKLIKMTGIMERRIADKKQCSSDICFEAANALLDKMNIDRKSIDLLIFVTQTPDYRIPATSILLQDRLGLEKATACFDINLGCSGYVYGLSIAYAYVSQDGIKKALLLVGDTVSKFVSVKDKATSLLFGDGGSATLIEKKDEFRDSYFSLNSDGSRNEFLKIKAGGYRNPSSYETLLPKIQEDGNIRSDEELFMNGTEIFNFTLQEVPKDIKNLLKFANNKLNDVDFVVYHQANRFITDYLTKKLGYPLDRVPYSLDKYGNTSGASIPLTIVSELKEKITDKKLILCGFGVGLSWANALLDFQRVYIDDLRNI